MMSHLNAAQHMHLALCHADQKLWISLGVSEDTILLSKFDVIEDTIRHAEKAIKWEAERIGNWQPLAIDIVTEPLYANRGVKVRASARVSWPMG